METNASQVNLGCIKCKLEKNPSEMNKHSVYKDRQRYICKSCNSERVALQRNLRKLKNVATMYPQSEVSVSTIKEPEQIDVSTEIKPVSKPYIPVATNISSENLAIIQRGRDAIAAIMEKHERPAESREVTNDYELEEVPELYI